MYGILDQFNEAQQHRILDFFKKPSPSPTQSPTPKRPREESSVEGEPEQKVQKTIPATDVPEPWQIKFLKKRNAYKEWMTKQQASEVIDVIKTPEDEEEIKNLKLYNW